MRIAIRVDASLDVGSGHVMRCLTLADALRDKGADVLFICRQQAGDLCGFIRARGYGVLPLPLREVSAFDTSTESEYEKWLGVSWQVDLAQTQLLCQSLAHFDVLIVDHYGLDARWEQGARALASRVVVIDDLANRPHDADLLLDQNYAPASHLRYPALVPAHCHCLLGPQFALIRPHFALLRDQALARRQSSEISRLLVFMGGCDVANETGKVLQALLASARWRAMAVDVVAGESNPHNASLAQQCQLFPNARLHIQTPYMADLMCHADLALTAGGSATWERCVLGLPAIVAVMADNQSEIANAVHQLGAHFSLGGYENIREADYIAALESIDHSYYQKMVGLASQLCDGRGAQKVANYILSV